MSKTHDDRTIPADSPSRATCYPGSTRSRSDCIICSTGFHREVREYPVTGYGPDEFIEKMDAENRWQGRADMASRIGSGERF